MVDSLETMPAPTSHGPDSLELALAPLLPGVDANTATRLARIARRLPRIFRGGYECRLSAGDHPIDLGQFLIRDDAEWFSAWAGQQSRVDGGYGGVANLARHWADQTDPVHRQLVDLWLEVDDAPAGQETAPSIFVGFEQSSGGEPSRELIAARVLEILGVTVTDEVGVVIGQVVQACQGPEFLGHLGVMLSRHGAGIRLNVKRLSRERLKPFLDEVRWPGDWQSVRSLADLAWRHADRVTVCFDLAETLRPTLAFECTLLRQPPAEPRWSMLLQELVTLGLCEPARRDACLRWPGATGPRDSPVPWPDGLVLEEMCGSADSVGVLIRRLSHVKLGVGARGIEAKAYLWFSSERRPLVVSLEG
ncbi:MAG: hypothetical protein ABJC74_15735 [Gemmatimonadota bacterium]